MYDVVIAGSGPAGLSAAVYARRAMLKTIVVEKAGYSGGQIVNTDDVDNYLGMQGVSGFDMAMNFRSHAEHFGAEFVDGEIVKVVRCDADSCKQSEEEASSNVKCQLCEYFELQLADGRKLITKTIIVATGASHSKLGVPGEKEYTGKGVSYCATCDGAFYRDKQVAVIGGGDVALEDALYLSKIASKVYLIHRRDELRGAKSLQDKIFATDNIEFVADTVVTAIYGGDNGMVTSAAVKNVKTEQEDVLDVNGLFIAIGMKPETAFVSDVVKTDEKGYIVAGEDGVTGTDGIFVAGDVRTKALRQVVTAVADGANAVYSVEKYLTGM